MYYYFQSWVLQPLAYLISQLESEPKIPHKNSPIQLVSVACHSEPPEYSYCWLEAGTDKVLFFRTSAQVKCLKLGCRITNRSIRSENFPASNHAGVLCRVKANNVLTVLWLQFMRKNNCKLILSVSRSDPFLYAFHRTPSKTGRARIGHTWAMLRLQLIQMRLRLTICPDWMKIVMVRCYVAELERASFHQIPLWGTDSVRVINFITNYEKAGFIDRYFRRDHEAH